MSVSVLLSNKAYVHSGNSAQDVIDTLGAILGGLEGNASEMGIVPDWGTLELESEEVERRSRSLTGTRLASTTLLTFSVVAQKEDE